MLKCTADDPVACPGAAANEDQIQELRDIVAWRLMGNDVTDEQAKWRDDAIMRSQSTSLIERRVRMALAPAIVAA